ncbi:uncharacterized protein LOC116296513 [Actinia tenebrosa]|uniref:Uncharacterized protein LOC116296513 n=1 Tax=Actinia tenebrosa TaxID=6105 RepID=A0A6P8HYD3_ACTTE|nr:uncharacterized protein LOC116296513 [Actinia tenebrosa]
MNTMLVRLLCTFVLLVVQAKGSSIRKRFDIPSDCKLQAGSNACNKNYLCGTGDVKTTLSVVLFCPNPASQLTCAVPLVPGGCGKQICPCVDHNGKRYNKGQKYMYGELQGAGELFECTCDNDSKLCGAVCERLERVPVQKPRPPPTFPPFPFPPGFGR